MRTDSQAQASVKRAAVRNLFELTGPEHWWETFDALVDLGLTLEEVERAIREN